MSSSTTTHIDLLRHGDTGHRSYRGQLDDTLLELGWRQMRDAVLGREWDVIVSSPLQRCAAFAQELAQSRGLPLALEPALREYHFGDWQGRTVDAIAANEGEALARFWADPVAYPPPGAERFVDFANRLTGAVGDLLRTYPGRRVLVVTHGGVIRLLRCLAAGRRYTDLLNIDVAHASLHALPWPPKPPRDAVDAPRCDDARHEAARADPVDG